MADEPVKQIDGDPVRRAEICCPADERPTSVCCEDNRRRHRRLKQHVEEGETFNIQHVDL